MPHLLTVSGVFVQIRYSHQPGRAEGGRASRGQQATFTAGRSTTSGRGCARLISRLSSREHRVSAYALVGGTKVKAFSRKSSDAFAAPGGGKCRASRHGRLHFVRDRPPR